MEKNGVWHSTFRIPAFMVNTERKATLVMICNLLQEVAGEHALHHNLGYEDMKARGQFWVLNRLRVHMKRFPDWRSKTTFRTWVNSMKGPFSYRNFAIYDEKGSLIGAACTLWVLLDAETRHPIRIKEHGLPIIENEASLCGQPDKLQDLANPTLIGSHQVKYSDLDMIGHVNNVKYIEWLTDCLDTKQEDIGTIDINYLQESFLDDVIEICQDGNAYKICKKGGEEDLCRVRFVKKQFPALGELGLK